MKCSVHLIPCLNIVLSPVCDGVELLTYKIQGLTTIFSTMNLDLFNCISLSPLTSFTDDTTANFVTFDGTVTHIVT